jgi:hypothetical protein
MTATSDNRPRLIDDAARTVRCPICETHLEVPRGHAAGPARCGRCGYRLDLAHDAPVAAADESRGAALPASGGGPPTGRVDVDSPASSRPAASRIAEAWSRCRAGKSQAVRPLTERPSFVIGLGALIFVGVPAAVIALIEILGVLTGP